MPFLADEPPVLCDWLPWNHTSGGNHNFGIVLYNGGTLYIDEGKPTPEAFDATRAQPARGRGHGALHRAASYEMLLPHLRADAVLRERFFSAAAAVLLRRRRLGQRFWDELQALAVETCGEELLMVTGLGATETAPFAMCTGRAARLAGFVGCPRPGRRAEARAGRREDRSARARAEHHARLLAATRS